MVRAVAPEVFGPIHRPSLNWAEIRRYLRAVGGESWADRRTEIGEVGSYELEHSAGSDGDTLVEFNGRACYRSWEPGLNANVTRVRADQHEYLGNVLSSGHGSVTEHANYGFMCHNVSRVFTHEMVRHRAGVAISQESMRFVRLTDIPFWQPEWAQEDEELMVRAQDLLVHMEEFQTWMAGHFGLDDEGVPFSEKKAKTSYMRRYAPDGVATSISLTFNIRAIRHIVYMRTALGAEEEIRIVCDRIAEIMLEECPGLMQDYSPNEDKEWIPDFLKV